MKPVRTPASNFVYRGPTIDIGDAWVERSTVRDHGRDVSVVRIAWLPTPEERQAIAAGALIELGILGMEPIPPVSLDVRPDLTVLDEEPPVRVEGD